jgi:hypothetical protein
MKYVGVAYTPFGSSANLIVSLGGVIQKPGLDFSIVSSGSSNTSTIRFTTAPTSGLSDFIISLGGQGILTQDPAWSVKGDLIAAIGNDAATILPVGVTSSILTVDPTTSTGLAWKNTFTGNVIGTASSVTNGVYTTNFTGSNQSLGSNGYQKLPGGLIMQWGTFTTSGSKTTVTFPTAFTTACYNVQIIQYISNDGGGTATSAVISTLPTTTQVIFSTSIGTTYYWSALGV